MSNGDEVGMRDTETSTFKAEIQFVDENSKLERMADEAHQVWCNWMEYMFKQGSTRSDNGPWIMNESAKRRWARQMITPYAQLSESEKASDRDIAKRYLDIALQKEKEI